MLPIVKIIGSLIPSRFIYNSKRVREYLEKKGKVVSLDKAEDFLSQAPPVINDTLKGCNLRIGIVPSKSYFLGGYYRPTSSFLSYLRFCRNNDISYEIYNIYQSDWLKKAESLDVIFWHVQSNPCDLSIARHRIYILDVLLKKHCFPSFHEIWQYEDKMKSNDLFDIFDIPHVNSFVSYDFVEALNYVDTVKYPLIAKTKTGASSSGVIKITDKENAKKYVHQAFSKAGRKSIFPYYRDKNYVLFQEFVPDAEYDLRIMLVGNKAFGYYRYPKKGGFKASGSGIYQKKAIPDEALLIAIKTRDRLGLRLSGVDMLYSIARDKYLVIEASLFNQIDSPAQLELDGVPGYYDISDVENITFVPGKYWIHELVCEEILLNCLSDAYKKQGTPARHS